MRNELGSIELLRNLCVLRKPDAVNGSSVPPPVVMEYQVQVDGVKAKLKETGARKKQQEDLIMKVENQVLKVSYRHYFYMTFESYSRVR